MRPAPGGLRDSVRWLRFEPCRHWVCEPCYRAALSAKAREDAARRLAEEHEAAEVLRVAVALDAAELDPPDDAIASDEHDGSAGVQVSSREYEPSSESHIWNATCCMKCRAPLVEVICMTTSSVD